MSSCGHDGWVAGCPVCEAEHDRALELLAELEQEATGAAWLENLKTRIRESQGLE